MSIVSENKESIKRLSSPLLEFSKVKWGRPLGRGSYGLVNEVFVEQKFALKTIVLKDLCETNDEAELDQALNEAYNEFKIMNKHLTNVVRSYEFNYDEKNKKFSFTMDLMENDLENMVNEKPFSFKEFQEIFIDITKGNLT